MSEAAASVVKPIPVLPQERHEKNETQLKLRKVRLGDIVFDEGGEGAYARQKHDPALCYLRSSVDQWIRENGIAVERQQRQQRPARTARQRPRGAIAANLNRARQQRPKTDPESRLGREDEVNHSKIGVAQNISFMRS
jgi:hypothetical protein